MVSRSGAGKSPVGPAYAGSFFDAGKIIERPLLGFGQITASASLLDKQHTFPKQINESVLAIQFFDRLPKAVARIVKTIAVYDDFCHSNDPYEEHDFGSLEPDGHLIFFKIDYFDKA